MSFIDNIKKVREKRNHKIKNSYGVQDAYKYYKKIRPKNNQFNLTQTQYSQIIREINNLLILSFLQGNNINFPKRMGTLYLVKNTTKLYNKKGKLRNTYPINWKKTLELWETDQEAYNNRSLVKDITKQVFKVKYDKSKANYLNKSVFDFKINRAFKLKLKECIIENKIDAYIN